MSILILLFACFSSAFGKPVKTSCTGGNWYIQDDADNRYFYRCYGYMSINLPKTRCGPGTCVPANFGAQDNPPVSPCSMLCDNLRKLTVFFSVSLLSHFFQLYLIHPRFLPSDLSAILKKIIVV